jgi:hypothetical protein
MLVKVLNFGTNWWARFGRNAEDPYRFSGHAAYYNSTGVRCGSKIRRHWITSGLIRFNGVGDFNPNIPERAIGRIFLCSDLTQAFGGSRLLFQSKAPKSAVPDWYLVVISSDFHGQIDFSSSAWKSAFSKVIAASQLREKQEVMLLMKPSDWVQTRRGFWQLNVPAGIREQAQLTRMGGLTSA